MQSMKKEPIRKIRSNAFILAKEKAWKSVGDGLYIEPDAPHGCVCLEEDMLINSFVPMRADFLSKP